MLTPDEIAKLIPAERAKFRSPIPSQSVSSDEFFPAAQTHSNFRTCCNTRTCATWAKRPKTSLS